MQNIQSRISTYEPAYRLESEQQELNRYHVGIHYYSDENSFTLVAISLIVNILLLFVLLYLT